MKRSIAIAVGAAALLAAGMTLAQDRAPSAQSSPPMSMSSHMSKMDEHMKNMQALHDKTTSAATPEERHKLMDEQRAEMQAGMSLMNRMQGGAMTQGMGTGMMGQDAKPADADARMQMMHRRMDMMQMMMQAMMDQHAMTSGPERFDAAPKK